MPHPDELNSWAEGHPDEGLLHEWLDDQLPLVQADMVASHVAGCTTCQERVAEARGLVAASRRILTALDDVPSGVIPAAAPGAVGGTVTGAAAGAVTRAVASAKSSARTRREFPWRRIAQIAAVLVIGVPGVILINNGYFPGAKAGAVLNESKAIDSAALTPTSPASPAMQPPKVVADSRADEARAPLRRDAERSNAAKATAEVDRISEAAKTKSQVAGGVAGGMASGVASASPASGTAASPPAAAPPVAAMAASTPPATSNAMRAADVVDTLDRRLAAERQRRSAGEVVLSDSMLRTRLEPSARKTSVSAFAGAQGGNSPVMQALSAPLAVVPFDSLTLSRVPCVGRCDGYELHINGAGAVRLVNVSATRDARVVPSQLANEARQKLNQVISTLFAENGGTVRTGRTECVVNDSNNVPTLRLVVVRGPAPRDLSDPARCTTPPFTLSRLAAAIDSIAATTQLVRRLPPE